MQDIDYPGDPATVAAAWHVRPVAIRVSSLSKVYPIYESPRDRLKQFVLPRLQGCLGRESRQYFREFWALRDIDITVTKGETVGIIGRNGSGKSTLLQIICGTLRPTKGHVETHGRIAALLELGAGFNPEFTGRENVFLNGAILGLSSEEIESRVDDIIAFADIGDFIDQPVKTYSSGMFVRLAFAVQACIDPEILVVDEALSVGDIGFQYKCFKRMEALHAKGVTILLVTHATGSVLEYADRCIVLDSGRVVQNTTDVLAAVLAYEKGMLAQENNTTESIPIKPLRAYGLDELRFRQMSVRNALIGEKRFGSARAIIDRVDMYRADGKSLDGEPLIRSGEEVVFRFCISAAEAIDNVILGLSLSKTQGGDVWGDNNLNAGVTLNLLPGERLVEYRVRLPLSAGEYLVHCGLARFEAQRREELDQRRPTTKIRVWSTRAQVGVVYAPIRVTFPGTDQT